MFKRNIIAAAAITLAAAACGSDAETVQTGVGDPFGGHGPGSPSWYTDDYEPLVIRTVNLCQTGDSGLYHHECPFEPLPPRFDPATGPGSNSLSMEG